MKKALFIGALTLAAAAPAAATSHGSIFETTKFDSTSYSIKKCTGTKCVIQVAVNMKEKPCAKTNDNGITVLDLRANVYPVVVYWEVATAGWSFVDTKSISFKKTHPFANPQKLTAPEGFSVELKAKPGAKDHYDYGMTLTNGKETCLVDPGVVTDW
jgi:hypothetical protein